MNALDLLAQQVRAHPRRIALVSKGREWTVGELWRAVGVHAAHLAGQGVRRGDIVALSGMRQLPHLLAIMGATRIGAVTVTLPRVSGSVSNEAVASALGVTWWIDGTRRPAVPSGIRLIAASSLLQPLPAGSSVPPLARGLGDALWRIALSSGTTGTSKAVPWTHRQRLNAQRLSIGAYPVGPTERMMLFADVGIAFGLNHSLTQLSSGGTLILAGSASPAVCLKRLHDTAPTRLVVTTALASSLVDELRKAGDGARPRSLVSVNVSGSAVSPALLQSMETLLCANVSIAYGATEMGSIARSEPAYRLEHPGGAGRLMPWVEAQAVGDDGAVLPHGEHGMLQFRAPKDAAPSSYLADPQTTAAVFSGGWFAPGDRGAVYPDGHFTLLGRADDRINVDGRKIDPGLLEAAIQALPGVRECAVVTRQDEEGRTVLLLALAALKMPARDVLQRLAHEHVGVTRIGIVRLEALPRNAAGKIMRGEVVAVVNRAAAGRTLHAG